MTERQKEILLQLLGNLETKLWDDKAVEGKMLEILMIDITEKSHEKKNV